MLAAKRFVPVVDSVYELEDIDAAFEKLSKGKQFGKLLVVT